jgi:hypothetical protein
LFQSLCKVKCIVSGQLMSHLCCCLLAMQYPGGHPGCTGSTGAAAAAAPTST